jgi:hypothetical protein
MKKEDFILVVATVAMVLVLLFMATSVKAQKVSYPRFEVETIAQCDSNKNLKPLWAEVHKVKKHRIGFWHKVKKVDDSLLSLIYRELSEGECKLVFVAGNVLGNEYEKIYTIGEVKIVATVDDEGTYFTF